MSLNKILSNLKYAGFINMGQVLSSKDIFELSKLSKEIFEKIKNKSQESLKHPDYFCDPGMEGLMRLPQHNVKISKLINKLLCKKSVSFVLQNVLGRSYKIWQINFRRVSPNSKGLYVHQDARGETNLCIILSDNTKGTGATTFLEGSHLVSRTMKEWKIEVPPILLRWLSFLFTPLKGNFGDVGFFFNRTWHGRLRNNTNYSYDVIFISFFPAGGVFGFEGYGLWSPHFLKSNKGTLLGSLIDPSIGTERLLNGQYKVLKKRNEKAHLPYVFKIEKDSYFKDNYGLRLSLIMKITLIRTIFFFGKPFQIFFKKFKF